MVQPGQTMTPLGITSITGGGLTCYPTMPAPQIVLLTFHLEKTILSTPPT